MNITCLLNELCGSTRISPKHDYAQPKHAKKNVSNLCQVHKLSQILLGLIIGVYHENYGGGGGGGGGGTKDVSLKMNKDLN